ncbi:MAG: cytochrome c [Gammaproteobacteria bacterium]
MLNRRAVIPALALAALWTLSPGSPRTAVAQEAASPKAVIETRQASLKKMGAAMKAIVEQLKTSSPDTARMTAAMQVISAGAPEISRWFPAGTGPESGVETDALPHIWEDRAKFDSLATGLVAESKNLAAAISGSDPGALRAQVKVVADVCSSCHRSFRAD